MKAPTYTDEQIIEAGMQLLADNKRVSPFAIRNVIGGGNPKRIKRIWEESQHKAVEGQMVREQADLPTEFEDALEVTKQSLDELAKRMYNRAQEIAESRVRETITAARKAKETAETEIAEAMDAVNSLDHDKQQLALTLEQVRNEREQANAENTRLQERINTLTRKAQQDAEELKAAKKENSTLRENNTTLRVKNELVEQQLAQAQQQVEQHTQELAIAHQTHTEIKMQLTTTQNENGRLNDKAKDHQAEIISLKATIKQLTDKNHQQETALAVSNSQRQEVEARIKEMVSQLNSSRKTEEVAKREAAELQGQLKALQNS